MYVCASKVQRSKLAVLITLHLIFGDSVTAWNLESMGSAKLADNQFQVSFCLCLSSAYTAGPDVFRWILGDPNSSLHACKASTLLSEPSPRPLL